MARNAFTREELIDKFDCSLTELLKRCKVNVDQIIKKVPFYGAKRRVHPNYDPLYLGDRSGKLARGDFTIFQGDNCDLVHSPFGSVVINTEDCYVIVIRKEKK
jgi:hypothetical protein